MTGGWRLGLRVASRADGAALVVLRPRCHVLVLQRGPSFPGSCAKETMGATAACSQLERFEIIQLMYFCVQ